MPTSRAGAPLRVALLLDRPGHGLPPRAGRQKFFPSISRSVATSSIDSASSFFSLPVLLLERLQPLGVGHLHAAVLRPPRVERRVADPVLAAQLRSRCPGLLLLQDPDDLLLGEPRASSSVSSGAYSTSSWLIFGEHIKRHVTAMADDLGADLDQLLAQAGRRLKAHERAAPEERSSGPSRQA